MQEIISNAHKIDVLIVRSVSRIGHEVLLTDAVLKHLKNNGVKVISMKEGDISNAFGMDMQELLEAV